MKICCYCTNEAKSPNPSMCVEHYKRYYGEAMIQEQDDIELQLLAIDYGDACMVRVEKGKLTEKFVNKLIIGFADDDILEGEFCQFESFAEIRDAINIFVFDEKPVPRIEQIDTQYTYAIVTENESVGMWRKEYDALCQLAGKPLPIWTPKVGTWERIYSDGGYRSVVVNPNLAGSAQSNPAVVPIEIWRYTLRRA